MRHNKIKVPAVPKVLLSIVSVQAGSAIAKGLFPALGASSTTACRIVLSAVLLFIFNRPNLRNLSAAQWKGVTLYGLTLGVMNLLFYMAISRIPLALGVALEFVGPLALAIAGSKRLIDFLWVSIAIAGLALITPWHHNGLDLFGVFLALLAGVFWATYIVLGGRISKLMDGGKAVTIGMIIASLLILPVALADGLLSHIKPVMVLPALGLALFSSAIPFTLEMSALRTISAKAFSILMSLEPAVAAFSGLIFLHEYLSVYEYVAIVLIIIASAGSTFTSQKADDPYLET